MGSESFLLPGAVVIGCGLVGAGLYFGLREAKQPPAAPGPAATPAVAVPGARARAAGGDDEVRRKAEQAARAAIDAEKQRRFLPECWAPAVQSNPQPPTSRHVFALGFDAQGRENVRGVNDIRGESREDVGRCLQRIPMGIRIPPPGVPLSIEITVDLP